MARHRVIVRLTAPSGVSYCGVSSALICSSTSRASARWRGNQIRPFLENVQAFPSRHQLAPLESGVGVDRSAIFGTSGLSGGLTAAVWCPIPGGLLNGCLVIGGLVDTVIPLGPAPCGPGMARLESPPSRAGLLIGPVVALTSPFVTWRRALRMPGSVGVT